MDDCTLFAAAFLAPTNDISIEFEIRPKLVVHWFKTYYTDRNDILLTSRSCNIRDVCKISLGLVSIL